MLKKAMRYGAAGSTWLLATFGAASLGNAQALQSPPLPETTPPAMPKLQLPPDIVVQARADDPVRSFVEQMTQKGPTNQIGRWKDNVCPVFAGLSEDQAATIEQRMVAAWQTVGLSRPPRRCAASLIIIFTNEAGAVATDLAKRYPITLRGDGEWLLRNFVKSERPVRWLTISNECGFGCSSGSLVSMETAPSFASMLIIVDGKQLAGITLNEMADYLSFISLCNPTTKGGAPQNSIMSLFDRSRDAKGSRSLTDRDHEFLQGLYHASANLPVSAQRSEIIARIKRFEKERHSP